MSPQAIYGFVVLTALALNIYTALDARATSPEIFTAIGRSKGRWQLLCLVGAFTALFGIGIAIQYLWHVRPKLRRELAQRGLMHEVSPTVKVTRYLLPALCIAVAAAIAANSAGH